MQFCTNKAKVLTMLFPTKLQKLWDWKVSFINKVFVVSREVIDTCICFTCQKGLGEKYTKFYTGRFPAPLAPYPFVRHFDRKATHFVYLPLNKGIPVTIFQHWTCIMNKSPKTEILSLSCSAYQIKRYSQKVHLFKIFYFKARLNN